MAFEKKQDQAVIALGKGLVSLGRRSPALARAGVDRLAGYVDRRKNFLSDSIRAGAEEYASSILKASKATEGMNSGLTTVGIGYGIGRGMVRGTAKTFFETVDRGLHGRTTAEQIAHQRAKIAARRAKYRSKSIVGI